MRRAQAVTDYLILLGLLLLLVIPLMYLTFSNLEPYKKNKISESLEMVKDSIEHIVLLGPYASTEVIIQLPETIWNTSVEGKSISVWAGDDVVTIIVPSLLQGVFPMSVGYHYLRMYNNGSVVFFYECGNNDVEAFEQCDGTSASACVPREYCYAPGAINECHCSCSTDFDCTTHLCDTFKRVCISCVTTAECASGYTCLGGNCVA